LRKALSIQTPEGISFPVIPASPIARFLALAIDLTCVYALCAVAMAIAAAVGLLSSDLAGAFGLLATFGLSVAYPIILEWRFRGQTLGKKILRLRVADVQALRLTFSQIVVRNLLRCVDALPGFYLAGGVAALLSRRGQRIGDLAANTIVVHEPALAIPDEALLTADRFNSFRSHLHLVARLRQNVSSAEAAVLIHAIRRRGEIEPASRVPLFEELRTYLQRKVAFPAEVVEGVSAEQYVRNAVDVLFRP
jgi:uncharacterized RDD family membrane protein YckC